MTASPDLQAVDRGFSAKAQEYDDLAETHPVVIWMRRRIRETVERALPPPARILELNAGSGLDAAYLASHGYTVHATDIAEGMLRALAGKASQPDVQGRITYERRSFFDLSSVLGAPFDVVFSNLGGLNCTDDLSLVTRELPGVLRPGGTLVWILMPRVTPWELAQALRGHWGTATRRLRRGGTVANVEGAAVPVWYHTPGTVERALGPSFRRVSLRSLCLFAPPPFFEGFVRRHQRLTHFLMRLDDAFGGCWPLNRAGDFYIYAARYEPR
jgi:ubiquinone/menaquinone biosynthesis C-methylase UbiE